MAPKITLIYFDFKGRAEAVRLALHVGGVEFEDKRLSREEWGQLKPNTKFGQVPVIHVDGEVCGFHSFRSVAKIRMQLHHLI